MDPTSESLKQYTNGNGIDISRKPFLRAKCRKLFRLPDNYFSLKDKAVETADFILCDNLIQETKYHRILIREAFYALKTNGFFIVQYIPKELSLEELEREIFLLMKESAEIENVFIEDNKCTVVARKTKPNQSKPDGINNWSFGIVTRGTTDNLVDEIIDTIKMQKIPNYEIIVCGKYAGKYKDEVVYIYFMQKDEKGWTTKKKNLICEAAKYENLLVMHDRIKLHKDWFSGMKKYGNNFDILSMKTLKEGARTYDWLTLKYPMEDRRSQWFLGGHLEYSDWDKWIYIDGGVIILKKYVWQKVKWDETRYWCEAEDSKLSHDQTRYGFLTRFNPYSSCESFRFNHPFSKLLVKKNVKKYGRLTGPFYLVVGKYMRGYGIGILGKIKRLKK
jgi:hypothetical protein